MHECQRYNGLVMRGLYRPSYHFITTLIGAPWPDLGGLVARFGWDRGPIWVGSWPDLGGPVAPDLGLCVTGQLCASLCLLPQGRLRDGNGRHRRIPKTGPLF